MKYTTIGLFLLLIFSACSDPATKSDKEITLKFALGTAQSAYDMSTKFKELIEAKNIGIKVNIYPDHQLGGDREMVEATQFGDIDITLVSSTPVASFYNNFYIFDIPFLFSDREQAHEILDGEIGTKIGEGLKEKGLRLLVYPENGFRNLTTKNTAVNKPEDLKGLKLRVMENDIHITAWKLLGANPTPMAFTELFTALQQGTVDGQENAWDLIYDNKFNEVNQYIIETRHSYTTYVTMMNDKKFKSLTKEQQEAVLESMYIARDYQRELAVSYEQNAKKQIIDLNKNTIITLTDDERAEFRKLLIPVYDIVRNQIDDKESLDEILAIVQNN